MDEKTIPQLPPVLKKHRLKKWLIIILIIVLLGIIGFLGWLLKQSTDSKISLDNDKKQLQSKIDTLTKQLADKTKPIDTPSTAMTPCSPATPIAQGVKDNIKDAITSQNTAALESTFTNPIKVVVAASEKGGPVTPAQAVSDLDYLKNGTAPWNFALPAATIASYKAGFYGPYFGERTYVGKAANNYVVSFGFDDCAKINTIFMSVNDDLLL